MNEWVDGYNKWKNKEGMMKKIDELEARIIELETKISILIATHDKELKNVKQYVDIIEGYVDLLEQDTTKTSEVKCTCRCHKEARTPSTQGMSPCPICSDIHNTGEPTPTDCKQNKNLCPDCGMEMRVFLPPRGGVDFHCDGCGETKMPATPDCKHESKGTAYPINLPYPTELCEKCGLFYPATPEKEETDPELTYKINKDGSRTLIDIVWPETLPDTSEVKWIIEEDTYGYGFIVKSEPMTSEEASIVRDKIKSILEKK